MIRNTLATVFALLLAACSGGPVQPDWQSNAYQSLEAYTSAYLTGNTLLAEQEFKRARNDLASTGSFELVARAELLRCGVEVASLEFNECPGFVALAPDAGAAERHYADFLQGLPVSPSLLPEQYRAIENGQKSSLNLIESPLSRLIAAGVLLRRGGVDTENMDLAIETAAGQGWRRPLLAWLETRARHAEYMGDQDSAARLRRQARLVAGGN